MLFSDVIGSGCMWARVKQLGNCFALLANEIPLGKQIGLPFQAREGQCSSTKEEGLASWQGGPTQGEGFGVLPTSQILLYASIYFFFFSLTKAPTFM